MDFIKGQNSLKRKTILGILRSICRKPPKDLGRSGMKNYYYTSCPFYSLEISEANLMPSGHFLLHRSTEAKGFFCNFFYAAKVKTLERAVWNYLGSRVHFFYAWACLFLYKSMLSVPNYFYKIRITRYCHWQIPQ